MSISNNDGVQAAVKAAAAYEPIQSFEKKPVEEKQYDKLDEKGVALPESKPYVVTLTGTAVKRSPDLQKTFADEQGGAKGSRVQPSHLESDKLKSNVTSATDEAAARVRLDVPADRAGAGENAKRAQVEEAQQKKAFVEAGKVEQKVESATDQAAALAASSEPAKARGTTGQEGEAIKSAEIKTQKVESAFKELGTVEPDVKSATDEAAERAAVGEPVKTRAGGAETEAKGVETLAKEVETGLKDPGTAQTAPVTTETRPEPVGPSEKAKVPEALERTGTVAEPVDKRRTEPVEKQDQAGELRKSISVYA